MAPVIFAAFLRCNFKMIFTKSGFQISQTNLLLDHTFPYLKTGDIRCFIGFYQTQQNLLYLNIFICMLTIFLTHR